MLEVIFLLFTSPLSIKYKVVMMFPFKMRCLNGPLAGRDVMLPHGTSMLNGHDPDFLMAIAANVPVTLNVTETDVRLCGEVPIWIDGLPCLDNRQALPLEKVIDLSGQAFVLGHPDAELSNFKIPVRQEQSPAWRKPAFFLGLCCLFLLCGGIFSRLAKTAVPKETATNLTWLASQCQQLGLHGIQLSRDKNAEIILSGYCEKNTQLLPLYQLLAQQNIHYKNNLICRDSLLQGVHSTLASYGYLDIDVALDLEKGIAVLDGNITADARWEIVHHALMKLRGISMIKASNTEYAMFNQLLDALHEQVGMEGLSIVKEGSSFLVSGAVSAEKRGKIEGLLKEFNQGASRLHAYFQNIPTASQAASLLPAEIVSYGGADDSPMIQLANGLRLYPGSVLANDYTLEKFYATGISLRKAMRVIFIPVLF